MKEIVEIMDNVEDMPDWMQEAFRTGRVYHTCVKKVAELQQQIGDLCQDEHLRIQELEKELADCESDYRQQVDKAVELHKEVERLSVTIALEAAFLRACVEQWQGDFIPLGKAELAETVERLEKVLGDKYGELLAKGKKD